MPPKYSSVPCLSLQHARRPQAGREASARVQAAHVLHRSRGGHFHAGALQLDFYQPQKAECGHAGEHMAADFTICPMTERLHRDLVVILGLAKGLLHRIAVKVGQDDAFCTPIGAVGDEHILAKTIDVPAASVIILAESEV